MMEADCMTHWRGKRVDDLSRAELLEVVHDLSLALRSSHSDYTRSLNAWQAANEARARRAAR
jgi:hypothetical protein